MLIAATILVLSILATSRGILPAREHPISIAVLPFENLSQDRNLDAFCDGLTEQLLSLLGRMNELRVPGRASAYQTRALKLNAESVATRLGVEHLLEGSVRSSAIRLRIAVRLVNIPGRKQVWAQTYERSLGDFFALEDEIGRAVANALHVRMIPAVQRNPTMSTEALQLYLSGRHAWYKNEFETAAGYFDRAIDLDPGFAHAYAGLARALARMAGARNLGSAEEMARRALEIDETLSEAALVLGTVRLRKWDWLGAGREFERAVRLNPLSAETHGEYAIGYLAPMGRMDEAIAASSRGVRLEPFSPFDNIRHGVLLMRAHRYPEAEAQLRRALEMSPEHASRHLGKLYLVESRYAEALDRFAGEPMWRAITLAKSGRYTDARAIPLDGNDAHLALLHEALGNRDKAFGVLESAKEAHDLTLAGLDSPLWDSLRKDSRFRKLEASIGLYRGGLAIHP